MAEFFRRLFAASIWAREGVSSKDWRYRGIFRWVLPVIDIMLLWFGIVGWVNGIASVQEAASATWQEYWSFGISLVAVAALTGVSFPRLWRLELLAKIPLIGLISVYVVVLAGRSMDSPMALATAGLVVILLLMPLWRVMDLGVVWRRERLIRKGLL